MPFMTSLAGDSSRWRLTLKRIDESLSVALTQYEEATAPASRQSEDVGSKKAVAFLTKEKTVRECGTYFFLPYYYGGPFLITSGDSIFLVCAACMARNRDLVRKSTVI